MKIGQSFWSGCPQRLRVLRFTILSALALLILALAGEAMAQEEFPQPTLSGPRFGIYHQTKENGFDEPYTDFRALLPLSLDENLLLFSDLRFILDNGSNVAYNLGGGVRGYLPGGNLVWGLNAFADQTETDRATYNQFGAGWELLFDRVEFRQNFYIPSGTDRSILASGVGAAAGASPFFRGNFLSIAATRTTVVEQSLKGLDTEVGGRLPILDNLTGDEILVRGYLGGYYFDNPDLQHAPGISGRINVNYRDISDVNLFVQHDSFFGTQLGVGVALYFDALTGRSGRRSGARDHLYRPVQRRQLVTIARGAVQSDAGVIDLTNPNTGQLLTITHVAGNAGVGNLSLAAASQQQAAAGVSGSGTAEDPFQQLPETQNSDIVYLHAGSEFNGQSYVLAPGQRLLGEGDGFVHTINTQELGTIALPSSGRTGPRPVLRNSMGAAVTLANSSEVANLDIINPTFNGIYADSITGGRVNNVAITSNVVGSSSLDGIVRQSSITINALPTDVAGMHLLNSQVSITGSFVNTMALGNPGIRVEGSDVSVENSSITTTGTDAPGILLSHGKVSLNNSTVQTSGDLSIGITAGEPELVTSAQEGALYQGISISLSNSSVTTAGDGATGIGTAYFSSGGLSDDVVAQAETSPIEVIVSDSTIRTTGNGSPGIALNEFSGVGTVVPTGILPPSVNSITVARTTIVTEGISSPGISGGDADVVLTDSTIKTSGAFSNGFFAGFGKLTASRSNITTQGDATDAIAAFGTTINVQDSKIVTQGIDADAIGGTYVQLMVSRSTLSTQNEDSDGVRLSDSKLTITGSSISTANSGAIAIDVSSNSMATILSNSITTTGDGAPAIRLDDSNGTITGNTILTSGLVSNGITLLGNGDVSVIQNTITAPEGAEIFVRPDGLGDLLAVTINLNTLRSGMGTIVLDGTLGGTVTVRGFANAAALAIGNGIPEASVLRVGVINYVP